MPVLMRVLNDHVVTILQSSSMPKLKHLIQESFLPSEGYGFWFLVPGMVIYLTLDKRKDLGARIGLQDFTLPSECPVRLTTEPDSSSLAVLLVSQLLHSWLHSSPVSAAGVGVHFHQDYCRIWWLGHSGKSGMPFLNTKVCKKTQNQVSHILRQCFSSHQVLYKWQTPSTTTASCQVPRIRREFWALGLKWTEQFNVQH